MAMIEGGEFAGVSQGNALSERLSYYVRAMGLQRGTNYFSGVKFVQVFVRG